MDDLTRILMRLEDCARHGRYESLETDSLEIKPVPPTGSAWNSIRESVCAFLNAHGGTIVLGVRDEQGPPRSFVHTGYTEASSAHLAKLRTCFQDARNHPLDAGDCLRFEVKPFLEGQIAIIRISPLPADRKFCFFQGEAFDRVADRDEKIPARRIQEQEERKREMETFREQRPVEDASLADLSLQRINELVLLINQGQSMPIETIKGTLTDAEEFLRRKRFIRADGAITTLGMLVCGTHPEEHLLFRCHLDAFVEIPNIIAQDKKTFRDNILQLMEAGHAWTLRNIMTGVSPDAGGTLVSEYPDKLIRESINNAFAHRDYSINRPVQLTIQPRHSLSIRNPGHLPPELVLDKAADPIPVRRIFSNPLARNPRLADILKLHNKWEGKGIGMSDLVNHALNNVIDVPYFTFHSAEELSLTIPAGKVLDEDTALWFELLDGFIQRKTGNRPLTEEQQTVLAYVLKSERQNRNGHYTLALPPGNNHFRAIDVLKTSGLIELHPASEPYKEVFVVSRELITDDHWTELRQIVGAGFADLSPLVQQVLNLISIAEKHSREGGLNARQVGRLVMTRMPEEARSRGIEEFQRTIRRRIEAMSPDKKALKDISDTEWISAPDKMLSMRGSATRPLFRINRNYQPPML